MRIYRSLGITVLLILLSSFAVNADEETLHIIELHHRPASEVQPLVQPLLQPGEGITGTGYQLFLRASSARARDIERLVTSIDVEAKQLTVTVRQRVARNEQRSRNAVSGDIRVGNRGRVVIPDESDTNGTQTGNGLRYRLERRSSNTDETHVQTLRVREGQRAFIRVGQSVPSVERVLMLTGRHSAVISQGVRYQNFVSGFDILPRVRGDKVLLEITPKLTNPGQTNNGNFRFQELQTTVVVPRGQWFDLGTLLASSSDVNRAILQSADTETGEQADISIKIE